MLLLKAEDEAEPGTASASRVHLLRPDSRQVAEEAIESRGVLIAPFSLRFEARQLRGEHGRLEFGDHILGAGDVVGKARAGNVVAEALAARGGGAVPMEGEATVVDGVVVCDEAAAFAAVQVLAGLEAEGTGHAEGAYFAAAPFGEVCLAGVLNYGLAVLLGNGHDSVDIGRRAGDVDGHDDAGFRSNSGFDLLSVDLKCLGIGIDEDRQSEAGEDDVKRGDEGVGR